MTKFSIPLVTTGATRMHARTHAIHRCLSECSRPMPCAHERATAQHFPSDISSVYQCTTSGFFFPHNFRPSFTRYPGLGAAVMCFTNCTLLYAAYFTLGSVENACVVWGTIYLISLWSVHTTRTSRQQRGPRVLCLDVMTRQKVRVRRDRHFYAEEKKKKR